MHSARSRRRSTIAGRSSVHVGAERRPAGAHRAEAISRVRARIVVRPQPMFRSSFNFYSWYQPRASLPSAVAASLRRMRGKLPRAFSMPAKAAPEPSTATEAVASLLMYL
jgi:hypothetical protein